MSDLTLDVGLAAKLKVAFARNGWTEQLIDAACEGDKLGQFKQVLLGHAAITVVEHVIDCDAQPFVPDGWSVEEHQKGGAFKWDKETQKDALYLSKGQAGSKYIEGNKLRKELTEKSTPVLNANVLDYLLANPHLIPEEWKGKYVFFWGTVYRYRVGNLYVRCLYWDDGGWFWGGYWLGLDWRGRVPAALRAS
ncbi:hypothetical protein KGM48_01415 [Patescibacteria group bacterium]|nr:hypothetical protein [Patescibacteria group bacterium]